jgi:integrase
MAKVNFTDRYLKALKPAALGTRYEVADAIVPGLYVRVTDKADGDKAPRHRTFVLVARYPGSKHPTRRAIGEYDATSLDEARETAREWLRMIRGGKDPRAEEERARQAELRKQAHTFAAVAEEYFASDKFKKLRTARDIERDLKRLVVSRWKDRALADITRHDVKALIKEIAVDTPYMAHLTLAYVRSMFNWICAQDYGVEVSPCAMIKPKDLIGSKEPRQRVMTDAEIKELWHATDCVGYPFGPMVKLLLLTGVRRDEAAGARWSEIDLDKRLWIIPSARFKSGTQHLVPLTDQSLALLDDLPRFAGSDYLFTTGKRAVSGFSRAKQRIDQIMAVHLKQFEPWRLHDIRRTFRSGLASLRVPDGVAELALGHGKRGLQKVYDLYRYEPELREALTLWGGRVRDLVLPPPKKVTPLRKRRA